MFTVAGSLAAPLLPATGLTLVKRGPQGADAITNLAAKDARVYRALVRLLKYSAYAELTMFAGCIAVAVAVDAKQLRADNLVARRLLGDDVIEELLKLEYDRAAEARNGAGAPEPAPAWAQPANPLG